MPKSPRFTRLSTLPPRARAFAGVVIGLGIGVVFYGLRGTHGLESLERRLVDVRTQNYLGTRPADPDIVLAVVQDEDVEALREKEYLWPWDLSVNTLAFDWLAECKVKAVAVDVYQSERGSGPEEVEARDETRGKAWALEAEPLADAYRHIGNVVLAYALKKDAPSQTSRAASVRRPEFDRHMARLPAIRTHTAYEREGVELPVVRLLRAAASVGYANADQDDDGTLRKAGPVALLDGKPVLSLPAATAMRASVSDVLFLDDRLRFVDAFQALDDRGSFLVNFRGYKDSYARVRPSDMVFAGALLEDWRATGRRGPVPSYGTAKPEAVEGRIVVWGVNPAGYKDIVPTPVDDSFPGPEYQATVIDNLLHGDGRVPAGRRSNLWALLGLSTFLGWVGGATKRRSVFVLVFVGLEVATVVAAFLLFEKGTSWDVVTPVGSLVFTYAGVSAFQAVTEGRRNKWLEGTFGQYLSPTVIQALKTDPTLLELGGRRRDLSVIFSDVKGFTSISERLSAADLVALLNDYLTRQSAQVLAEDGVIDKFIGDAVMAFFGDPVPLPDHAFRACRAAVRSVAALPESAALARSFGVDGMENRIGVASGPAFVGNMGSEKRFDYTAIGDTVNFASRLEGANKVFGSRILISGRTQAEAGTRVVVKPLARLQVVGKSETVPVFELLALRDEAAPEVLAHAEAFARAQAAVLDDRLDDARKALDEAERARPDDGPCRWLRALVEDLESGARKRPWDGIYVLESK